MPGRSGRGRRRRRSGPRPWRWRTPPSTARSPPQPASSSAARSARMIETGRNTRSIVARGSRLSNFRPITLVRMTMVGHPTGVLCERARTWAALAPDGELSELERKLLDAHLQRCAACGHFAVEVAAVAAELRAAAPQRLPQSARRADLAPAARLRARPRRRCSRRSRRDGARDRVACAALGERQRVVRPAARDQLREQGAGARGRADHPPGREREGRRRTRFRPKKPGSVMRPI